MTKLRWLAPLVGMLLAPPLGAATIEGRVIHSSRPEAVRGLEVLVVGVDEKGDAVERSARTDAEGRFRVRELPRPGAYLVSALYGGVRFPGGTAVFREEDPKQTEELTFHIYEQSSDASRVAVQRVRLVVEREAGQYRVVHSLVLSNPGLEVVLREERQPPALRAGLLRGHGEPQTAFGPLTQGVRVERDTLELHGPLYPGDHETQLFYEMNGPSAELDTALAFPEPVQAIELFVHDFGIEVDAGPLHPSRPIAEGDQIYQRWIGFDLAAGTVVPLRVRALPPQRESPGWLQAALAALLAGAAVLFVGQPVREAQRSAPAEGADDEPEREALHVALQDLEHDFETGKLSREDRDRLRHDLKREAVTALRSRGQVAAPAPAPAPSASCECGHMPREGERFCAACGRTL